MTRIKHVLLLIETSKAYGRFLLNGIGRYAMTHGRWSLFVEERGLVDRQPKWLKDWSGDGIIFRGYHQQMVDAIKSTGLPAVETNNKVWDRDFPLLYPDDREVARIAVEHFQQRQFQHFAFCTIEEEPWVEWRRSAYIDYLDTLGKTPLCFSMRGDQGRIEWDELRNHLADWLGTLPKPVAVLAANDICGMRVIDACRSAGISVPEQVAVLGVDNDEVMDLLTSPPLSSIDLNIEQTGYQAAALLDRMMRDPGCAAASRWITPAGVVPRQSTDVSAIDDPTVTRALSLIRRHACDGITVDELLDDLLVSRATLERHFEQKLGRSPKQEIIRVRIGRTRHLLAGTDYPLAHIAELTGFKTASHLSVVFKRETGSSPSDYRSASRL